jgi:hypothetical protein
MDRLFVLVTEIGGTRKEFAIFPDEGNAGAAYFDIYNECVEGRSEENVGDPAAVTDCWLYEVPTASEEEARAQPGPRRPRLQSSLRRGGRCGYRRRWRESFMLPVQIWQPHRRRRGYRGYPGHERGQQRQHGLRLL